MTHQYMELKLEELEKRIEALEQIPKPRDCDNPCFRCYTGAIGMCSSTKCKYQNEPWAKDTESLTIKQNDIALNTDGLDEGIRCAMCTNPMANDRGCDGGCRVNETMYKKVLDVIKQCTVHKLQSDHPQNVNSLLEEIKNELHATAEMHSDGDYYLRDEWIDEYIDKYMSK